MGEYKIFSNKSSLSYQDQKDVSFPIYVHELTKGSQIGQSAFFYFFKNTNPDTKEEDCPGGCWMIGMYEVSPSSFWFGRQKQFWIEGDVSDQCPDGMFNFVNQTGQPEPEMKLTCME